MIWSYFLAFALISVLFWAFGALAAWRGHRTLAVWTTAAGTAVFFAYIVMMWAALHRPPLRTMGETRLWYSLFLPVAGLLVYVRWRYRWILSFSTVLATVFVCINIFKPEIHSRTLMPALQSPWFAPHVIIYMMAYALLGAAALMALYLLLVKKSPVSHSEMQNTDNMVNVGVAFITIAMLMGALWAKEAWGHYWSWDPKETWAGITWLSYLVFVHYRYAKPQSLRPALWMLVVSFCLLQMCWWGINYLSSAQGASIHTYSMQ